MAGVDFPNGLRRVTPEIAAANWISPALSKGRAGILSHFLPGFGCATEDSRIVFNRPLLAQVSPFFRVGLAFLSSSKNVLLIIECGG